MHNLSAKITQVLELSKLTFEGRFNEHDNLSIYKNLPKASDLLIVTLSIVMEYLGVHSEYQLYNTLKADAPDYFGWLPDRTNFNRRRRKLHATIDEFANYLAMEMCDKEDVFIIDSTPIEICRFARFNSLKIMQDNIDFKPQVARNYIDKRSYAGYKLHAVVSTKGVIINYELTQANVHDVTMLQPLAQTLPSDSQLIGDKGYISKARQLEIFTDNQVKVYTASRSGQRPTPFPITSHKQRIRKRIETCFSQLKDQYRLASNYAKSFYGFMTRVVSKIAAFTVAQYINFLDNKPLGKVKYAI